MKMGTEPHLTNTCKPDNLRRYKRRIE
uniref:Uncharacterized protein n=1 Tax=Ralstonia solanacearum TaxID=305 RepID=A0A0S4W7V6_RALSL|nr:protein of unknown function [Ralstonia solanacearum]CUV42868.1 protein of unknown function [Ralstonia solanacearum]